MKNAMMVTTMALALGFSSLKMAAAEDSGREVTLEDIFKQCLEPGRSCASLKEEYKILSDFEGIPIQGDAPQAPTIPGRRTSSDDGTVIKALKLVGETAWRLIKDSQAQASARGKSAALVPEGVNPDSIQWSKRNTIGIPFKVKTATCDVWRGICSTAKAKVLLVHQSDGKYLRVYAVAQRANAKLMWTLDADVQVENMTRPDGKAEGGTIAEMLVTVNFKTKLHPLGINVDDDLKGVTYRLYGDGRFERVGQ